MTEEKKIHINGIKFLSASSISLIIFIITVFVMVISWKTNIDAQVASDTTKLNEEQQQINEIKKELIFIHDSQIKLQIGQDLMLEKLHIKFGD